MMKISATLVGLGYGFVVAFLAFGIAGAGHGWTSAFISAVAVFLIPFAALALVSRRRRMALIVISFGALADVTLIGTTFGEGWHYVQRAVSGAPRLLLIWFVLWTGWQIGLLATLFFTRGAKSPNSSN